MSFCHPASTEPRLISNSRRIVVASGMCLRAPAHDYSTCPEIRATILAKTAETLAQIVEALDGASRLSIDTPEGVIFITTISDTMARHWAEVLRGASRDLAKFASEADL